MDIKHNEIYGRPDEAWTDNARSTQRYLNQLDRWRQGEVATHTQLHDELAQNRQLDLVDENMSAVDKALGGAARDR